MDTCANLLVLLPCDAWLSRMRCYKRPHSIEGGNAMQPQILNVDILDDKEPHVLVQKYIYPDRTFQVFRKPTSPDERFEVSRGVEIDPDMYWHVPFTLT